MKLLKGTLIGSKATCEYVQTNNYDKLCLVVVLSILLYRSDKGFTVLLWTYEFFKPLVFEAKSVVFIP